MEKSTIEVATELMEKKKTPQPITKLLKEVSEIKGVEDNNVEFLSQLYIDITTSGRFIFCGEDLWDLKERHVDLWDKDGSFFNDKDMIEEDEEDDMTVNDYSLEEDETYEEDYDDDSEDEEDGEFTLHAIDDDSEDEEEVVVEEEEFDEDNYDKVMNDYEKYYDE